MVARESVRADGDGSSELPEDDKKRIISALRQIARMLDIHSRKLASENAVTSAQLSVLRTLGRSDVGTATEIAARVHSSPSTVVGILDRLQEKNLVTRTRDEDDRRVVTVSLTPAGAELAKNIRHPVEEILSSEGSGITESETQQIADCLDLLVHALSTELADVGTSGEQSDRTGETPTTRQ
jgi:DNA-binding MarR family transcriptional regulator